MGAHMGVCGVCGRQRTSDVRFTKLLDGWVCADCIRESAVALDFPDFEERVEVLARTPLATFRIKVENGQRTRDAAAARRAKEVEATRAANARRQQVALDHGRREYERIEKWANRDVFPVTTNDLDKPYEVIGPVFFQTSNAGYFGSTYDDLARLYRKDIARKRAEGVFSPMSSDWMEFTAHAVGQNSFDPAFYICVEELKRRAIALDADGIVGFKMDFDLDTNGYQYFYAQVYGTAVRFVD